MKGEEAMLKPDRRLWWIALCAVLGIVLMLLFPAERSATDSAVQQNGWQNCTAVLEQKAAVLCSRVSGVGEVTVAISLTRGAEQVYADENARQTVLLTEHPPEISGIGVVCSGGDDPAVVERLISLLSAAFGVATHRIYIVAG